jgi:Beta-ketoacyl synthase, N-terminal domain
MAPPSGQVVPSGLSPEENPEDVVIAGMAGRFPESDNIYQFRDNLYNKVDMITQDSRRWDIGELIIWFLTFIATLISPYFY